MWLIKGLIARALQDDALDLGELVRLGVGAVWHLRHQPVEPMPGPPDGAIRLPLQGLEGTLHGQVPPDTDLVEDRLVVAHDLLLVVNRIGEVEQLQVHPEVMLAHLGHELGSEPRIHLGQGADDEVGLGHPADIDVGGADVVTTPGGLCVAQSQHCNLGLLGLLRVHDQVLHDRCEVGAGVFLLLRSSKLLKLLSELCLLLVQLQDGKMALATIARRHREEGGLAMTSQGGSLGNPKLPGLPLGSNGSGS